MEIKIEALPPKIDSESVTILKQLNRASRALGQLKGEVSKIPNSQILLDTLTLQEAKDSNLNKEIDMHNKSRFLVHVSRTSTNICIMLCTIK